MRGSLANLGLALAGVLVALGIFEMVVRLTGLATPNLYVFAQYRGWKLSPGAFYPARGPGDAEVRVNNEGFRGPERSLAKPPGVFRVAVLGDSFTEAQQVPYKDTFCAVMERRLASCPALAGKRVQVLDFGVDGYGTAQEYLTLARHVWQFSPDFVVLAVFTGNDIRNDSLALEGERCRPFYEYRGGRLVLDGPFIDSPTFRFHCWLRFESRHIQFLDVLGKLRAAYHTWRGQRSLRHGRVVGRELGIDDLIYEPPPNQLWRNAWRVTEGEIQMIHDNAVRHHAGFLVVTLSNPVQVRPDPRKRAGYMKYLRVQDLFYPDRRIAAAGRRDGYAVLNLAPQLQQWVDGHGLAVHGFGEPKGHWNELGHRLAGELIAQRVGAMLSEHQNGSSAGAS